jgi:hypothetical protein
MEDVPAAGTIGDTACINGKANRPTLIDTVKAGSFVTPLACTVNTDCQSVAGAATHTDNGLSCNTTLDTRNRNGLSAQLVTRPSFARRAPDVPRAAHIGQRLVT